MADLTPPCYNQKLASEAKENGNVEDANRYTTLAEQAKAEFESWGDNGINRIALHAATQGLIGGLAGGGAGALSSVVGVGGGNLGQSMGKSLGEAEAKKQGLDGEAARALINTYQQAFAGLGGVLGGLVASSGMGQSGTDALASVAQGSGSATAVDIYNRQFHFNEYDRVKDNCRGSSSPECGRINKMSGVRSGMPMDDPSIPGGKVVANYSKNDEVVSYVIIDKNSNKPIFIMEPLEFAAYRTSTPGIQAMMPLSPQYALDMASANLYGNSGDWNSAKDHVISGLTSRDNIIDLSIGMLGGAFVAGGNGKPRIGISEGGKITIPENSMPPKGGLGGGASMVDDSVFLLDERQLLPSNGKLSGVPEGWPNKANADQVRSIQRQNEAGEILADHGLVVEYLPMRKEKGVANPDLRINGEIADVYSPSGNNVLTMRDKIVEKARDQAPNVVVNLADSKSSISEVAQFFQRNPVENLKSLTIIKDGKVIVLKVGK